MADIRWKQRFENFNSALQFLGKSLEATQKEPKNELYRIALIGSFQFCFELGWKTLKDYLSYSGISVSLPREVIKQAFHHQLIANGELWMDMLEDRNLMAHVYDEKKAELAA
jgi:nucleotidyltransferase substrate binding protein (TIGR01987 family)